MAVINQFWLVKSSNRFNMPTPSHKGFFSNACIEAFNNFHIEWTRIVIAEVNVKCSRNVTQLLVMHVSTGRLLMQHKAKLSAVSGNSTSLLCGMNTIRDFIQLR